MSDRATRNDWFHSLACGIHEDGACTCKEDEPEAAKPPVEILTAAQALAALRGIAQGMAASGLPDSAWIVTTATAFLTGYVSGVEPPAPDDIERLKALATIPAEPQSLRA